MIIEQPPSDTPTDLAEYLTRMFKNSDDSSIIEAGKLAVRKVLVPKPVVGKLYYYAGPISGSDITQEGVYIFKSTGYVFIA